MPFIYILQSLVNSRYYIGTTINLKRRLREHNEGQSRYTSFTKPFRLVFSQEYLSLADARKIESKLKKFKSRVIIEKIINDGKIKIKL